MKDFDENDDHKVRCQEAAMSSSGLLYSASDTQYKYAEAKHIVARWFSSLVYKTWQDMQAAHWYS